GRAVGGMPVERRDEQRLRGRRIEVPEEGKHDRVAGVSLARPVDEGDLLERALAVVDREQVGRQLDRLAGIRLADVALATVLVPLAGDRGRGRGRRLAATWRRGGRRRLRGRRFCLLIRGDRGQRLRDPPKR